MPEMLIQTDAIAQVNALHLLVKIADHLREDTGYTAEERTHGINCLEGLIRVLKTKTGNQKIVGTGAFGRG